MYSEQGMLMGRFRSVVFLFLLLLLSFAGRGASISGSAIICQGASTTWIGAPGGGTWSSSDASIATVNTSGLVTGVAAGTATITYTESSSTAMLIVTVNPLPLPITGPDNVCAGATIVLSSSPSGGTWNSTGTACTVNPTTGVVMGISAGTAVISYRFTTTTCGRAKTITVNANPAPIAGPSSLCLGSSMTLSDADPGGGWTSSSPGIASVSSGSGIVVGNSVGTAAIVYTLSTGCATTKLLTVNPLPANVLLSGGGSFCPGGSVYVGLPVGYTGISYQLYLSPGTAMGTPVTGSGAPISWGGINTPGTYYVIATNPATTCARTLSGTPTVNATTSPAPITGLRIVCENAIIALSDATTGGSWTSSAAGIASVASATGVVTGVASGTAAISYTLSGGCSTSVVVTVNPVPGSITGASTVCAESATTLENSTPGGTWSSNAAAVASIDIMGSVTGVASGTATISYTLTTGCAATRLMTVQPVPAIIGGQTRVCIGNTITMSDITPGGVWSSNNNAIATIGSITGIVVPVTTGTAVISYTLATGCARWITVTVDPTPSAITGPGSVCEGSVITLTHSAPGGTWASALPAIALADAGTGNVTGIAAGNTDITYILSPGCTVAYTITVNPTPPAITGHLSICTGAIDVLHDAVSGGTWSSSNTSVAGIGSTSGIISGVTSGTTTIYYTRGGCSAVATVIVNPTPDAITGNTLVCAGSLTTLSNTSPDGLWSSGTTSVATVSSPVGSSTGVSGAIPGTATISYTTSAGCMATTIVTVSSLAAAGIITGPSLLCAGTAIVLSATVPGGAWGSTAPGTASVSGTGIVTGITAGTVTIFYAITIACGPVTLVKTVTVSPLLSVILGTARVYPGTTTTLTNATPGGSWSSGDPTIAVVASATGVVTGVATGTAAISYSSGTGCIVTKIVTVDPAPAPITGTSTVCAGAVLAFSDASAGGTWGSSDVSVAPIATLGGTPGVVIGEAPGTATITYTLSTGCMTTLSITVVALPGIAATATPQACGGSYSGMASGGVSYVWAPATGLSCSTCAATDILPTATTTYTITGTDAFGCQNTATTVVNGNRIYGAITFNGPVPSSTDVKVWLIQLDPADSAEITRDSTITCVNGTVPYYQFNDKPAGSYMVRAQLLGVATGGSGHIPTYGPSSPYWVSGAVVNHTGAADVQNINIRYASLTAGPGRISGMIFTAAGRALTGGGPAVGQLVYLKDSITGAIVTHTYTDEHGMYAFSNIVFGNYIVYPEEYGYHTTQSLTLIVSPSFPAKVVNFTKSIPQHTIYPMGALGVATMAAAADDISIYPNPASAHITVQWAGQEKSDAQVTITDMTGRQVYSNMLHIGTSSGNAQVSLAGLGTGIYVISIHSSGNMHYNKQLIINK